jgi:hypothetical protein
MSREDFILALKTQTKKTFQELTHDPIEDVPEVIAAFNADDRMDGIEEASSSYEFPSLFLDAISLSKDSPEKTPPKSDFISRLRDMTNYDKNTQKIPKPRDKIRNLKKFRDFEPEDEGPLKKTKN